jgi:hypothetical protein
MWGYPVALHDFDLPKQKPRLSEGPCSRMLRTAPLVLLIAWRMTLPARILLLARALAALLLPTLLARILAGVLGLLALVALVLV